MSRSPLAKKRSDDEMRWAQPISKENLGEQAYLSLRQALMRGHLRPGEPLLLRPMSARFGISATPMREALLRLVSEKALALDARGSVVVPTLTHEQLVEIRAIRTDLEGRSAASAATLATAKEIDGLDKVHQQIANCLANSQFDTAIDLNTEFHLRLCKLGGMQIIYEIVESLWLRCGPIISHLYDDPPDFDPHPHIGVIAALRNRDPDGARKAIQFDIDSGGRGLLQFAKL